MEELSEDEILPFSEEHSCLLRELISKYREICRRTADPETRPKKQRIVEGNRRGSDVSRENMKIIGKKSFGLIHANWPQIYIQFCTQFTVIIKFNYHLLLPDIVLLFSKFRFLDSGSRDPIIERIFVISVTRVPEIFRQ